MVARDYVMWDPQHKRWRAQIRGPGGVKIDQRVLRAHQQDRRADACAEMPAIVRELMQAGKIGPEHGAVAVYLESASSSFRDPLVTRLLADMQGAMRTHETDLWRLQTIKRTAEQLAPFGDQEAIDDLHNIAVDIFGMGADLVTHTIGAGLEASRERQAELDRIAEKQEVAPTATAERLKPMDLSELLALDIKPREMVLAPIIPQKGLVMLYAARGTGKTHVGLGIARAVSSGAAFLRWSAPNRVGSC